MNVAVRTERHMDKSRLIVDRHFTFVHPYFAYHITQRKVVERLDWILVRRSHPSERDLPVARVDGMPDDSSR